VWWAFGGVAPDDDEEATAREREIYAKWQVGQRGSIAVAPNQSEPSEDLPMRGFIDVTSHQFAVNRAVSVNAHVNHLLTHSPVLALGEDIPRIRADLLAAYDGRSVVTEALLCQLTLARRP
jgi:hypothetical protein